MKKLFTIAAMIFAVAMTACTETNENPYDGAPEPVFTLSTSSFEVPQAGGNMEIPFTIENPGEWAQLRATTPTAWIKDLAWDQENGKITFTAPANNTDDPLTDGVITVAYNFKEYNISVTQLGIAYDYKWTVPAEALSTKVLGYADSEYKSYAIQMQIQGFKDDTLEGVANFGIVFPFENDFCFSVPAATYTFDANNTLAIGTIINGYSLISTDVENQFAETVKFASGTISMTADKGFVARMFDANGKSYRIECATTPHIDNPYPMGITEDTEIVVPESVMMGYYYWGAEYGEGTNNYTIMVMDMSGAISFTFDVISDNADMTASTMPTGTFTIAPSAADMSGMGDVMIQSFIGQQGPGGSYGSYMPNQTDYYYLWFMGGTLTITENAELNQNGAKTYNFKLDVTDASHTPGHKITADFSAECMFTTDKTSSAPEAQAANFEAPAYPAKARR